MIATAKMFLTAAIPGRPVPPSERRLTPVMPRRCVTPAELVAAVNAELAARADCDGLALDADSTLRARFANADGCNWSPAALRVRVKHGPSTRALAGVRQVVEWARLHLELADPAF